MSHERVLLSDVSLTLGSAEAPVNVLQSVSAAVAAAERVAVTGPSGAGKTSLLMLVAGLLRPTAGAITVAGTQLAGNGTRLSEDTLARFRGAHVGIVFQDFHLAPSMTALENAALPLELADADPAEARDRAAAMLERLGLGKRLDHFPAQLSGGEQQRVALARAFTPRPELILADEPTGNLDTATGERVMQTLFELTESTGATLLMVTHDEGLATRCDRVLHIADGRLTESERPARESLGKATS